MTKLEKILTKLSRKITEAGTTYSKYYEIEECKVRVSDHVSEDTDADIIIVLPINGGTKYYVSIPESRRFYFWTANQIHDFLVQFILYKKLVVKNLRKPQLILSNDSLNFTKKFTLKDICNFPKDCRSLIIKPASQAFKGTDMIVLENIFNIQFDTTCELSDEFKRFLILHPMTVRTASLVYKIIVIDNNKEFTEELGEKVLQAIE